MNTFDFVGFNPSERLAALAGARLKGLLKAVPGSLGHDAYIVLSRGGIFEGSIRISTAYGDFQAHAKGKDARQVLQVLYGRMKTYIADWYLRHPSLAQLAWNAPKRRNGRGGDGVPSLPAQ